MRRIRSLVSLALALAINVGCSTLPQLTPADLDRLTRDARALQNALQEHVDSHDDSKGANRTQTLADLAGKLAQGSDLAARLLAADQKVEPAPAPAPVK